MTLVTVSGITTVTMTLAPMQQMLLHRRESGSIASGQWCGLKTQLVERFVRETARHLSNWVWRTHPIYDANERRASNDKGGAYHDLSI